MSSQACRTAFIVSQGEEILTGLTLDTNANFLCARLTERGFRVLGTCTAGDRAPAIAAALRTAAATADVVVCTGGLGPTGDDLTSEGAALAFDRPVELVEEALAQVEARFAAMGRQMPPCNRRQAMLPRGCTILPNLHGTAPGFRLELPEGADLFFLPGVPSEMEAMWEEQVEPWLRAEPPRRHVFRTLGRGESQLQDLLGDSVREVPGVDLGFRAGMPEVQVHLVAGGDLSDRRWEWIKGEVRRLLGRDCFSERQDQGVAARVGELLLLRGERLALAESCTGGWIAHLCVSEPGSSRWLERGYVTYSNRAKVDDLGVAEATIEAHGAVSEETAKEMAGGARARAGVAWGLATTGIAGPTGGSEQKPAGTVCVAVDGPAGTRSRTIHLPARDRNSVRRFGAYIALDVLRRQIERLGG